ncbi:A/G-specific adenine glycosylase [Solidesulfovibrio carbinoliphilus subsp. oakridgensis]|uniref:Adenine DNA glycosylase n=1 Tax=Solidesulfovibrio carbinoliphilus subsp. oakridgensis TaxID=694327 RepID=G7QBW3_9BACT|nr:A/G-specific adenine glycosylase [Solidesulfovibrio carbinoliphilus]EHJ49456.1 A/G-specific adenine glycosylase [Solidesulfovibrio carbinoliphilus subsp. oakridgensis]
MRDVADFAPLLLHWFSSHARALPWRRDYDPYAVWVSEIMAQQTQMDRVVDYFNRFMARFPDIGALAAAPEDAVLKAWEGLGYYSRARNLLAAARIVQAEHGGRFPADFDAIRALPGIGDYTAGAVASIAFGADTVAVDANVLRVLARVCDIDAPVKEPAGKARVLAVARSLLPPGRARDYNQALMELGALVCRPKNPDCQACPVADVCQARHLGIVADRPVLTKTRDITPLLVATGVLFQAGRIFIQKRLPAGAWGNLWEFPGGRIEDGEMPDAAIVREFAEETAFATEVAAKLAVIRHGYTTFRVTLHCFLLRLPGHAEAAPLPAPVLTAAQESRWVLPGELSGFAFPAGHRKLIDQLANSLWIL